MVIGIDCRLWSETGVGRYIENLTRGIDAREYKDPGSNEYKIFLRKKDFPKVDFKSKKLIKVEADIPWHGFSEQLRLPQIIQKEKVDLVHFPYFSIPVLYNRPFIVTIHDLIINKLSTGKASTLPYPLYMTKRAAYKYILKNSIRHAKKIIVPSFAVKRDLMASFSNTPADKVKVIYEGGFEDMESTNLKNLFVGKRYFLRVGNMYPHKNVERLIEAFSMLLKKEENGDVILVLAGKKDYFFNRIKNKIDSLNMEKNVVFLDNAKDSVLKSLYVHSKAAIVPSLMEGFSLTCLEALSLRTIVIASDIPVHREVCGDSVIYFNPRDSKSLLGKMEYVLKMKDIQRKELVEEGVAQSQKFSWDKMVDETVKTYNDVFKTTKSEDYFLKA